MSIYSRFQVNEVQILKTKPYTKRLSTLFPVPYSLFPAVSEGVVNHPTLPDGGMQGKNDFGQLGFGGPCPPSGTHRYFFKLYALDQMLDLSPGASKADVLAAIEGHVLEAVELMGRYARQS
ncbi:PEBP family protein [Fischerella sp. NIES-4106]|nr:PEBP family protein [Fischerella sp. NIES-4106]